MEKGYHIFLMLFIVFQLFYLNLSEKIDFANPVTNYRPFF